MLAAAGGVVLSLAVEKLGEFSMKNLRIPDEVHTNLERLHGELKFMQSFMKDAEEYKGGNNLVKIWVSTINSIANEIVSVLEEFQLKIGGTENPTHMDRARSLIVKSSDIKNIGERIKMIFAKVEDLARKRKSYGICNIGSANVGQSSASTAAKSLRRSMPYTDADQLFVGLEDVKRKLMDELLKVDIHRCIISIYGIGGSGKTSLARSLYNSEEVRSNFPNRAWTYVSQEYTIPEILKRVIKSLENDFKYDEVLEKMSEEDLECYLREKLKKSKYLIVVDDVWERIAWESLKRSFPDYGNGSRVIVTTRKKDVASQIDERTYAHHLRFLSQDESCELFLKKLCLENKWPAWCSPGMQDLGRKMVEKCSGLPLALVLLGGLLAHKQSLKEWKKMREQIWSHLSNDYIEISHLFSLSFNDLSLELKQCFLYIGTFPEDHRLFSCNLSYVWMAEGVIEGEEMEDITESHLNELVNRNMIQVEREGWGEWNVYKIHDLFRNLAIKKALEMELFDIYDPGAPHTSFLRIQRHVISTPNIQRYVTDSHNTKLQSLIMYNNHRVNKLPSSDLIAKLENFNHLCILKLHLFETPYELLNTIGNLLQLKYLKLHSTDPRIDLPTSIGNLRRLQTLEICGGSCNLPSEISNLKNIRHLDCHKIEGNVAEIGNLSCLKTMRRISYKHWTMIRADNLVNLRSLVIENIEEQNTKSYSLQPIAMLKNLHTLMLKCSDKDTGFPPLDFLSSMLNLNSLGLVGKIKMLPPPEKWPKFLTMLAMMGSQLQEDPIPTIEKLPNLKYLYLMNTHKSTCMSFSSKCLPQLEQLSLGCLPDLKTLEVGEGALPIIKRIYIGKYGELKDNIPYRLKSIIIHGSPF